MSLLGIRQTRSRAGRSAVEQFKAQRWKVLRKNWLDWLGLGAICAGSIAAIAPFDGATQLIAAGILGAALMMALFGWTLGDFHSLPWLWGAVGERQTAEVLDS